MSLSLGDIATALGGELLGDAQMRIESLAPLATASAASISFVSHPRYRSQLATTQAGCVIVGPELRDVARARGNCIVAEQPYRYFARLTQLWRRTHSVPRAAGVHASAVVDSSAVVDPSAHVGPLCVVESGAQIGPGTVLTARVHVGADCVVGARCLLHPGVVIGADGFGFAPGPDGWEKIEQLGRVRIGDDVEIGANSCIDRGALDDTVLEDGCKLDNLVQIGHNVRVGRHTAMAGCAGVAGSAVIGAHCTIGGGAVVLGHLELVDHVHVSAASVVTRSILQPGHYSGFFPIDDNAAWEKNAAVLRRLYALRQRVTTLENTPPHRTPHTP